MATALRGPRAAARRQPGARRPLPDRVQPEPARRSSRTSAALADVAVTSTPTAAPDLLQHGAQPLGRPARRWSQKQGAPGRLPRPAPPASRHRDRRAEREPGPDHPGRPGQPAHPGAARQVLARSTPASLKGLTAGCRASTRRSAASSLHITLEVVPQRPAYQPGEEPAWIAEPRAGLQGPARARPAPRRTRTPATTSPTAPDDVVRRLRRSALPPSLTNGASYTDPQSGDAGTPGEQAVTDALFAPALGTTPQAMPDIADLLLGPMVRGTEVDDAGCQREDDGQPDQADRLRRRDARRLRHARADHLADRRRLAATSTRPVLHRRRPAWPRVTTCASPASRSAG